MCELGAGESVIELSVDQMQLALGATEFAGGPADFAHGVSIDSRTASAGELFFGLPGATHDGSQFGAEVLRSGVWGVVVEGAFYKQALAAASPQQAVFAVANVTAALGALATAWRVELGEKVVGITGSTGKTSTKDILAALLAQSRNVVATPENLNTEIGMPLVLLSAPRGTQTIVLEMAMRGGGQIAELTAIAQPDVGCIVNVGPVHLEQLGSIEGVAAAKAELIAGLATGAGLVVPAGERLLDGHLRDDLRVLSFGEGGDVRLVGQHGDALTISAPSGEIELLVPFDAPHMVANVLAAVACCELLGASVGGKLDVSFSALRGEIVKVLDGVTIINDCYNANPISMRAALTDLARSEGRRIAVLGGMAELGDASDQYHAEIAALAVDLGIDAVVTVGELARAYAGTGAGAGPGVDSCGGALRHVDTPEAAAELLGHLALPGDTVLVKGSRSVGLEAVASTLLADGLDSQAGVGTHG